MFWTNPLPSLEKDNHLWGLWFSLSIEPEATTMNSKFKRLNFYCCSPTRSLNSDHRRLFFGATNFVTCKPSHKKALCTNTGTSAVILSKYVVIITLRVVRHVHHVRVESPLSRLEQVVSIGHGCLGRVWKVLRYTKSSRTSAAFSRLLL